MSGREGKLRSKNGVAEEKHSEKKEREVFIELLIVSGERVRHQEAWRIQTWNTACCIWIGLGVLAKLWAWNRNAKEQCHSEKRRSQ